MKATSTAMRRPERWDQPFDPGMNDAMVEQLLEIDPFYQMDAARFPPRISLAEILKNDCRWQKCLPGEIVIREGDYGSSAFLVLAGSVAVSMQRLDKSLLGRNDSQKKTFFQSLSQLWKNPQVAEVRAAVENSKYTQVRTEGDNDARVFVQDLPKLVQPGQFSQILPGEIFGELAALTRTPRTATVVADSECQLLEIRWQGLRDLLKYDPALRQHIDQLYRQNSLRDQLRSTPLLKNLDDSAIEAIADASIFGSWGNFDWFNQFRKTQRNPNPADKILQEPVVVTEGDYANGLVLIRNGFGRISQEFGEGHRTIAYLGKGQAFGLRELFHNWKMEQQRPYMLSLRAVGYLDTIHIPSDVVEKWILPALSADQFPAPIAVDESKRDRRNHDRENDLETSLLEFLVESRVINGTQAMLVDRDRCTRCDDCVRACATAHEGNPRFVRSGPKHDNWMIAQACMHCMDPVCMIGCPTGAIGRDEQSGIVNINDSTCIGCGTCANSCPYQNIQMVPIRNQQQTPLVGEEDQLPILKATKCDLCMDQLGGPACQRACPHDALVRIDLTSPGPLHDFLMG